MNWKITGSHIQTSRTTPPTPCEECGQMVNEGERLYCTEEIENGRNLGGVLWICENCSTKYPEAENYKDYSD